VTALHGVSCACCGGTGVCLYSCVFVVFVGVFVVVLMVVLVVVALAFEFTVAFW